MYVDQILSRYLDNADVTGHTIKAMKALTRQVSADCLLDKHQSPVT